MKRRTKVALLATLLSILLGINYWHSSTQLTDKKPEKISNADYYFENVVIKNFNSDGQITSQLGAKKMEYFKKTNISQINLPDIIFKSKHSSKWQLTSATGELDHNENKIRLNNNVSIIELNTIRKTNILTELLYIDLEKKLATTPEVVKLLTQTTHTTSRGMNADFELEIIELTSLVESNGFKNEL